MPIKTSYFYTTSKKTPTEEWERGLNLLIQTETRAVSKEEQELLEKNEEK